MACENSKKTRGKQKIEMKKIENDEDKLITFSKRRSGIYKKASELIILTDAKVAFMVYSPAGKPFSFGHPSMEAIFNRFLGREREAKDVINPLVDAHRLMRIDELRTHHNELLEKWDELKEKDKELKQKMRGVDRNEWWDISVEELTMQELLQMEDACNGTRMKLIGNEREMAHEDVGASSSIVSQPQLLMQLEPQPQPPHMFNPFSINRIETQPFPPIYRQWSRQM